MIRTAARPWRARSVVCIAAVFLYLGFQAAGKLNVGGNPRVNEVGVGVGAATGAAISAGAGRSLAEAEAAHGPDSLEVARILSAMAEQLWGLEDYAAEKPLAERALALRQKALGEEHPDVASSLYQVAEVRRATGDYAGAMRFHRRALAIWEKTRGPEDSEVASSLHYLGVLSLTTGDRAQAKVFLERALAIREKSLGPTHELVATTLTALAEIALQAGDRAAALPLLARAQSIWEQALGPEHPFVARSLTSRAALLAQGGDAVGARRLLERAQAIRTSAFGPEHYLVARSMVDIANLIARSGGAAGNNATAVALYLRALKMQRRSLGPVHPEVATTLAALARLQWAMGRTGPALEDTLQAETMARDYFRRSARDLSDGEALQYEAIRTSGLDVALSILAGGGPAKVVMDASVRKITDEVIRSRAVVLDEQARAHGLPAQRETPRTLPDAGSPSPAAVPGDSGAGPGLSEVLDALPEDSALVAYVRFQNLGNGRNDAVAAYLALVLTPRAAVPMAIPLGAADRIDAAIAAWRAEVSADPRSRPPGEGERIYRDAGQRLREAIWDPLQPALAGKRLVLIVPDGAINQVSLTTLPSAPGRYLAETGPRIHYLSAERDLVLDRVAKATGTGVLVVGDPDFDAGAASDPAADAAPLCPEFTALSFDPLPGARAEAEEVDALWARRTTVLRLSGAQAREAAFKKSAPGRAILHLATHAYVLSDRCGSTRAVPDLSAETLFMGDRPLLRSGLALAGANRRGDARGVEDGILTAEEIAGLDLSGVEWAVLSGCDTGIGKVQTGEGVVGLRRAFEVAGARTLIMSLWAVDDGAARVWMRNLYEQRLAGLSTVEAVNRAGLRILDAQRARGRTTHPYYWGGFVAAGDWR